MKTEKVWNALRGSFLILFHLGRPCEKGTIEKPTCKTMRDMMIMGKVLPHKETVIIDELFGYTKTKVKVQKVYAGSCHAGEIIEICEPYYEGWYRGKKCLMVQGDYEPLQAGSVYRLLLTLKQPESEKEAKDQSLFYQVS